ncbi:MAG: twin-arginine translocase subunit TatC [Bradymonadales bacterium]|nr:MAG: twin-arginine translocase subunit TatC [Bradymonadales bacterium]
MTATEGMSFLGHLMELRTRVIRSVLGVLVGFLIAYSFSEEIFWFLMQPLCASFRNQECQLITIGVAEAFFVYFKTAILAGLFLAAPWVFLQAWKFIEPGLLETEKKLVWPVVFVASALFVGGAAFGYWLVFPFAFDFFLNYAGEGIAPMPAMQAYFSFSVRLLLAFGILFELPLVVLSLVYLRILSASQLWSTWRYAIIGIFALSAVLTPADPITMLLLGLPLSGLYLASILVAQLIERARKVPSENQSA